MYVLVGICLILGFIKSFSKSKGNYDFELIAKTCGSLCFVATGILAFYLSSHSGKERTYSLIVIIGLILGLIGDIFLCLYEGGNTHPKRKNLIQTAGVAYVQLPYVGRI